MLNLSGRTRWNLTQPSSGWSGASSGGSAFTPKANPGSQKATFAVVAGIALAILASAGLLALRQTGQVAEAAQQVLRRQFIQGVVATPVQLVNAPTGDGQIPVPVQFLPAESGPPPGSPAALMRIPAIDVDLVVVEGAGPEELKKGPGRHEDSALPGEGGVITVSGHRFTYGAPFRKIHRLRIGDPIWLTTGSGEFLYTVGSIRSAGPSETAGPQKGETESLVLTTSDASPTGDKKLVVTATFKEHRPRHLARLVLAPDNSAAIYQQEAAEDFGLEGLGILAATNVTPRRAPDAEAQRPEPESPAAPPVAAPPVAPPAPVAALEPSNPAPSTAEQQGPAPSTSASPAPAPQTNPASPQFPALNLPDPSVPPTEWNNQNAKGGAGR